MIPIYIPYLEKYKSSAIKAIEDNWISNHGIYVNLAAELLQKKLNVKYCILMNNGTSATHCLFKALKFKYPKLTKIYIPNNVFVAPWNCGLYEYNEDIFEVMKIDENTCNIVTTEKYFMSLENNAAVVIVHNLGNIVNVPRLKNIRPDLIFIEDNCEGIFGKYNDIYSGSSTSTLCSAVSFYGNKTLTTGEGGAFFTNHKDVYLYIKKLYSHGMTNERYIHDVIGYNYRMTNVQAALLYEQLMDLDNIINLKINIFKNYDLLLKDLFNKGIVKKTNTDKNTHISYWMYFILIPGLKYKQLEAYLIENNIQIRPLFYDIHQHSHLKNIKKQEVNSFNNEITNMGVMLPSYPSLIYKQQKYIINCLKEFLIVNEFVELK